MELFLEHLWQYILVFLMAATPWLEILIVIPIGIAMGLSPFLVGLVSFLGNALPVLIIVLAYDRFMSWWKKRKGLKAQKHQMVQASDTEQAQATQTDNAIQTDQAMQLEKQSDQMAQEAKTDQGPDQLEEVAKTDQDSDQIVQVAKMEQLPEQSAQSAHIEIKDQLDTQAEERKTDKKESKGAVRAKKIMQKYGLPGLALLGPIVTGIHLAVVIAIIMKANPRAILFWMNLSLVIWTVIVTVLAALGIDFLFAR